MAVFDASVTRLSQDLVNVKPSNTHAIGCKCDV
jgi:hypothetical protein